MGAHTAEVQSRGAYGVYFRTQDPEGLLQRMPPMHSMLNDLARAFYRRAVELCGARHVTVRELECSGADAPACRFEVRWK